MILINALGIQDSGGISVLNKLLEECKLDLVNKYIIICNENSNVNIILQKYKSTQKFKFKVISNKGFLYRLYYENIKLKKKFFL